MHTREISLWIFLMMMCSVRNFPNAVPYYQWELVEIFFHPLKKKKTALKLRRLLAFQEKKV
ncbi:hypothetical protein MB02_14875 [Croceicoccus estronivorus]|nr:hypothetical protein MB02_14875 [Croceicoccus estronivorus]